MYFCVVTNTKVEVTQIKWIQEIACQKDFFSHDSFNGSWRPSNGLPASAAHSGCAEWIQRFRRTDWGGSELYISHTILHMINKSMPHVLLCNFLCAFADMEKGLVGCTAHLSAANWLFPECKPQSHLLNGLNNRRPSFSAGEVHSFHVIRVVPIWFCFPHVYIVGHLVGTWRKV